MKKTMSILLMLVIFASFFVSAPESYAANNATRGKITGKTVVYGLTSLFIWPGIGQYLNDCDSKKNWTHALVGLLPPFRLFSGWDALVARKGGFWDGKI